MDDGVRSEQARIVAAAPLPMLLVDLATRRIEQVSDGLVGLAGAAREELIGADATQYLTGGQSPALSLLASGQIDGYEATRMLRYPDGRDAQVHVWAHSFGLERPPVSAVFVIDEGSGLPAPGWTDTAEGATVLGSVDGEWHVDRVSPEIHLLLGYEPSAVIGTPFLGAVHPGDVADLLTGLGHAERSGETVILRLRLRKGDGAWCWCRAWAAPLADTAAFAFMLSTGEDEPVAPDVAAQLNERLARIAYEVHAATALTTNAALPPTSTLPGLAELTSREWQVMTAVQSGSRAGDIAQTLNLAPSTVRNHLTAVYRKLGVGSQVELLAALNRHRRPGSS
jgi:DNA-binding CsgD family transcriptional regulator